MRLVTLIVFLLAGALVLFAYQLQKPKLAAAAVLRVAGGPMCGWVEAPPAIFRVELDSPAARDSRVHVEIVSLTVDDEEASDAERGRDVEYELRLDDPIVIAAGTTGTTFGMKIDLHRESYDALARVRTRVRLGPTFAVDKSDFAVLAPRRCRE